MSFGGMDWMDGTVQFRMTNAISFFCLFCIALVEY